MAYSLMTPGYDHPLQDNKYATFFIFMQILGEIGRIIGWYPLSFWVGTPIWEILNPPLQMQDNYQETTENVSLPSLPSRLKLS